MGDERRSLGTPAPIGSTRRELLDFYALRGIVGRGTHG